MNRISYCTFAAAILCCTSGCIQETTEGSTHTFTYEWWVPTAALLGGLVAVPAGWMLRRSSARGMTAVHEVKLDELTRIRLTVEESTGRRGRKRKNFYLLCERKDGTLAKVPVNNNTAEAAAPLFLENVAKRGIPLVDET
jgi:hypothetical protein